MLSQHPAEEKRIPEWECWAEQALLGSAINSKEFLLLSRLRELESCFSTGDAEMGAPHGVGWELCPAPVLLHLGSFFWAMEKMKLVFSCLEFLLFLGGLILWRAAGMKDVCEAAARLGLTQIFASEEGEVTRSIFIHIK